MENLKIELKKFGPEKFNEQYRNLIDIGQTANELEYEMLDALHFIKECETMFALTHEKLKKLPDENHCQHCDDKEKLLHLQKETLEMKDETIALLKEDLEKYRDKSIKLLEEKAGITQNNNLKVCEKEV